VSTRTLFHQPELGVADIRPVANILTCLRSKIQNKSLYKLQFSCVDWLELDFAVGKLYDYPTEPYNESRNIYHTMYYGMPEVPEVTWEQRVVPQQALCLKKPLRPTLVPRLNKNFL